MVRSFKQIAQKSGCMSKRIVFVYAAFQIAQFPMNPPGILQNPTAIHGKQNSEIQAKARRAVAQIVRQALIRLRRTRV